MARVINTDSTGKKRNQHMRTAAEILRRLSSKNTIDDSVRDMVAQLVYTLRDIDEGIEQSAAAWEKRDYWMKAEEFRERWRWAGDLADDLAALVFGDEWQRLPEMMIKLLPYFTEIKITKLTRDESLWLDSYQRLMQEHPTTT